MSIAKTKPIIVVTANVKDLSFSGAKRSASNTVQAVKSTIISGMIGVKSAIVMNSILFTQEFYAPGFGSVNFSRIVLNRRVGLFATHRFKTSSGN